MLRRKRDNLLSPQHSQASRGQPSINESRRTLRPSTTAQTLQQAARKAPRPSLSQMIEQKTWENDQLRQELEHEQARYRASHRARMYIGSEVRQVLESLKQSLANFEDMQKSIEERSEKPQ